MEYLVVSRPRPGTDPARLDRTVPAHITWITDLLRAGRLVRAGRWGDGGMYILDAPDDAYAADIVARDPLVAAGLVDVCSAAIVPPTA